MRIKFFERIFPCRYSRCKLKNNLDILPNINISEENRPKQAEFDLITWINRLNITNFDL